MTTSEDEVQQTKLLYTIATHPAADCAPRSSAGTNRQRAAKANSWRN